MSPYARHRRRWIAAVLGCALLCACGESKPAAAPAPEPPPLPAWLERVDIKVERAQPAFENHTELFISVVNRGAEPVVIEELDVAGALALEREGGAVSRIHPISVGVQKPIRIEAGKVKSTSLLFETAPGAPRTLRLYDREFSVSR